MTIYGYARVSTHGQALGIQLAQLEAVPCDRIFQEKKSGTQTNRRELKRLLHSVRSGDMVIVTRLCRFARSTRDLLNIVWSITGKGAGFRSLGDVWADTTTPHGRLMLTFLAGIAEFELDLIRSRTLEGRAAAKARGVKFGRHPKLTPIEMQEALARRAAGETQSAVAHSYRVSCSTISRLSQENSNVF